MVWRPVPDLGWFACTPTSELRLLAQTTVVGISGHPVVPSIDEGRRGLLAVAMSALVLRARPEGAQWTMER